jgi:hypothetical protein
VPNFHPERKEELIRRFREGRAICREGSDIELHLAECLGIAGYRFPVRPQQIVTMRFRTRNAVADLQPLTDWNPLVPEARRAEHPHRQEAAIPPAATRPRIRDQMNLDSTVLRHNPWTV